GGGSGAARRRRPAANLKTMAPVQSLLQMASFAIPAEEHKTADVVNEPVAPSPPGVSSEQAWALVAQAVDRDRRPPRRPDGRPGPPPGGPPDGASDRGGPPPGDRPAPPPGGPDAERRGPPGDGAPRHAHRHGHHRRHHHAARPQGDGSREGGP